VQKKIYKKILGCHKKTQKNATYNLTRNETISTPPQITKKIN
jgi:ABC-type uncharacterized transport system auxiliary subunit